MIAALSQGGRVDAAFAVYQRDPIKFLPSRTAMLTGFAQCGRINDARVLFEQIHEPNVVSWNAVITGYMQNEMVDAAKEILNRMPFRNSMEECDIFTWNTIITGYAQHGLGREAIMMYEQMQSAGVLPNEVSFVGLLHACSYSGLVDQGY
jgi:pentatricopeptide repeat protein